MRYDPLDLIGALVGLDTLCVSHEPRNGVLAGVTVAAEDLNGVDGALIAASLHKHPALGAYFEAGMP